MIAIYQSGNFYLHKKIEFSLLSFLLKLRVNLFDTITKPKDPGKIFFTPQLKFLHLKIRPLDQIFLLVILMDVTYIDEFVIVILKCEMCNFKFLAPLSHNIPIDITYIF